MYKNGETLQWLVVVICVVVDLFMLVVEKEEEEEESCMFESIGERIYCLNDVMRRTKERKKEKNICLHQS